MPKVEVEQEVKGSTEKVYAAVKQYMQGRDTLTKLGAEIEWKDKANTAMISGSNFAGEILVEGDGKKALVTISIDLPFLLSPFKGKVKDELEKHLSRIKV